jgi:hypothetical protein
MPESGVPSVDMGGSGGSVAISCGGTALVTGDTPGGVFNADTVYAVVDAVSCSRPGSIGVSISNSAFTTTLGFTVYLQPGASVSSFLGTSAVTAAVFMPTLPQHGSALTQGTVTLTIADDPLAAIANPDGAVTGIVAGTVTFVQDGFSLSGSFQSPYCSQNVCSSP